MLIPALNNRPKSPIKLNRRDPKSYSYGKRNIPRGSLEPKNKFFDKRFIKIRFFIIIIISCWIDFQGLSNRLSLKLFPNQFWGVGMTSYKVACSNLKYTSKNIPKRNHLTCFVKFFQSLWIKNICGCSSEMENPVFYRY